MTGKRNATVEPNLETLNTLELEEYLSAINGIIGSGYESTPKANRDFRDEIVRILKEREIAAAQAKEE